MIYELRIYEAAPGKLEALHSRFRDHTLGIFERHGIQSVGYWDEEFQGKQNLVYLLAFESKGDMEQKWAAFREDPEWRKVVGETERGGALASQVVSRVMAPTDYSPMK